MTFDERVYRRLLRLYPRALRLRFEDEMVAMFLERRRAAGDAWTSLLAFWVDVLIDFTRSLVRDSRNANRPSLRTAHDSIRHMGPSNSLSPSRALASVQARSIISSTRGISGRDDSTHSMVMPPRFHAPA